MMAGAPPAHLASGQLSERQSRGCHGEGPETLATSMGPSQQLTSNGGLTAKNAENGAYRRHSQYATRGLYLPVRSETGSMLFDVKQLAVSSMQNRPPRFRRRDVSAAKPMGETLPADNTTMPPHNQPCPPPEGGGHRPGWLNSPAFTAVVTFLVVLAGAAASLFTEGIRTQSWFPIPDAAGALGASIFWGLCLVAIALLFCNQRAVVKQAVQEQQTLTASLGQLDSAVRRLNTLPNETFLPSFQDSYGEALAAALLVITDTNATQAQVEATIRAVLTAIADTAKDFDGASSDTIYSAHLMVFRYREDSAQIVDALRLVAVTAGHEEYVGALELIPELSTSTLAPGNIDATVRAISLPIPTESDDYFDGSTKRTKSTLIPGAPTAYVKQTFEAFASIDGFIARLHDSSIDRQLVGKVQRYFIEGEGKAIKSFACLPIVDFIQGAQEGGDNSQRSWGQPLAVLNLQSSSGGLLADNGATLFAPLVGPFLNLVAILLIRRQETLNDPPPTVGTADAQPGASQ